VPNEETISILADPVEKIACRKCGAHLDVSRMPSFSAVVCPQCGLKQMVPALLGQFLLLELLGAGGMGAVYKALDQALGRYVAIKVMKQAMGNDPQFVENFLREARAAAAINHRNVVQIYSCGQEKGQPYIVMELISGGRLDEQIGKGEPLDEVRVLEIGVGVAEGLKAANDIGLIHGDIKPANVLFDKEGTAKVADFGLARFIAWQQNRGGEVWGTPYYIAPEKARGQKEDNRSDIYSLGATLYHALGAKPPFEGQTATDVVLARLKNPAVSIRVVRPSVQPETADVIGRRPAAFIARRRKHRWPR
jgi:serine/threonine protein kinase